MYQSNHRYPKQPPLPQAILKGILSPHKQCVLLLFQISRENEAEFCVSPALLMHHFPCSTQFMGLSGCEYYLHA